MTVPAPYAFDPQALGGDCKAWSGDVVPKGLLAGGMVTASDGTPSAIAAMALQYVVLRGQGAMHN